MNFDEGPLAWLFYFVERNKICYEISERNKSQMKRGKYKSPACMYRVLHVCYTFRENLMCVRESNDRHTDSFSIEAQHNLIFDEHTFF